MPPFYSSEQRLSYKKLPYFSSNTGKDPYFANVALLLNGEGEDNSLSIVDSSLQPKPLTKYGDVKIRTINKKYGSGCIYFDGVGDYLETDNLIFPSLFTLDAWVYLSSLPDAQHATIFAMGDTESNGFAFQILNTAAQNKLSFRNQGAVLNLVSSSSIAANSWTHVALSRGGSETKIFINGIHEGSTSLTPLITSNSPLRIGYRGSSYNAYLNGYLDGARITLGVARYNLTFNPETDTYLI